MANQPIHLIVRSFPECDGCHTGHVFGLFIKRVGLANATAARLQVGKNGEVARHIVAIANTLALLRDQQDFPRGTLFRCCVRMVRVFQCETLAKRDRQLPGPHGFSHVR